MESVPRAKPRWRRSPLRNGPEPRRRCQASTRIGGRINGSLSKPWAISPLLTHYRRGHARPYGRHRRTPLRLGEPLEQAVVGVNSRRPRPTRTDTKLSCKWRLKDEGWNRAAGLGPRQTWWNLSCSEVACSAFCLSQEQRILSEMPRMRVAIRDALG